MAIKLISLGLITIPFLVLQGYDTRIPKMSLALGVALGLSLLAIFQGKLKAFKNKPLLFLIGFLLLSIYFSPKPEITLQGMDVSNFWVWKPMFYISVFFLMLVTVSSLELNKGDGKLILNMMVWSGFIMALYCIVQSLNIDQFFVLNSKLEATYHVPKNTIGGTLGHPTIVSPFIAMIIPIAFYLKKRVKALFMLTAVCLTCSQIAIGAMLASLAFYIATMGRRRLISGCIALILASLILGVGYFKSPRIKTFVSDSGRFGVWEQIITDIKSPINKEGNRYGLTGFGPGSFRYIFPLKHNSAMHQAHNDFLELVYNTGIIGLGLFLWAIFYIFQTNFSFRRIWEGKADRYRMALLSSFGCILLCSVGTFCLQLGAHLYFFIVVAGLLHNTGGENV